MSLRFGRESLKRGFLSGVNWFNGEFCLWLLTHKQLCEKKLKKKPRGILIL